MSYIITVNRDSIPQSQLELWYLENKKYIADPIPLNSTLLQVYVPIDLVKFFKLNGPEEWIIENKDYINYEKSYETIEFVHTIDKYDPLVKYDDELKAAVLDEKLKEYNLQDLKDKGYDFDTLKHQEQYMVLEMDANKELKDASFSKYDNNKTCYSHPFFYSIVKLNSAVTKFPDKSKWKFYFMEITAYGKLTIAFCINFNNDTSTMKYYDYSQIPPGVY